MKEYKFTAEFDSTRKLAVGTIKAEFYGEALKEVYRKSGEWKTAEGIPFMAGNPLIVDARRI